MLTAYTEEVDEAKAGVAELLGQIDLGKLERNCAGLVTCHCDFAASGFVKELRKKLPCDLIGMTTMASANPRGIGMYSLSLALLTSGDVAFETAMTGPLSGGAYMRGIKSAYSGAAHKLPGEPSLIVSLLPSLSRPSGPEMHAGLDEACGGIPIWGGVAIHTDLGFRHSGVFRNGDVMSDGIAMLLMHGPVDPEFVVVSAPLRNVHGHGGKITKSSGCLLKEIDGMPARRYLETIGIAMIENAPMTMPLMIYCESCGEPVARAIYAADGDGSLICGGEVLEGSLVAIGEITSDTVTESAEEGMKIALGHGGRLGALVMPCACRYLILQPNHDDEFSLVAGMAGSGKAMPFMAAYSGGEMCPVRDCAGRLRNRFHNFTFTACVF